MADTYRHMRRSMPIHSDQDLSEAGKPCLRDTTHLRMVEWSETAILSSQPMVELGARYLLARGTARLRSHWVLPENYNLSLCLKTGSLQLDN